MEKLRNLKKNVVLAPHTTYKIGGKTDLFFAAKNQENLIKAVEWARENGVPYFILGCGANILIGDKGFRGLVIQNQAASFKFEGNLLVAESGALISDLTGTPNLRSSVLTL